MAACPINYDSKSFFTSSDNKDLIACGSYATVRRCYHSKLKCVVVKYFLLNGSKELMFQKLQNANKEAKILEEIYHDNIIQVFGITSWRNFCGIIMEEVPGGTLEDLLLGRQACIPWKRQLKFFYEISCALNYLHHHNPNKKFIHGDLKPQNILLTNNFTIKLADFGSVTIIHATGMLSSSLNPSSKQYTPLYSAPEFLNDFTKKTCAIDVYSFGMIGYEILTRHRVFDNAKVALSVLINLISGTDLKPDVCLLNEVKKSLSENSQDSNIFIYLKKVLTNCWNSDPAKRPKSSELYENIHSFMLDNKFDYLTTNDVSSPCSHSTESEFDSSGMITLNLCLGPSDFSIIDAKQNALSVNVVSFICAEELLLYLSLNLCISYRVISNFKEASSPQEVTLANEGDQFIPHKNDFDWSLFFNDFHILEHRYLSESGTRLLPDSPFELIHVDGTLYRLKPTADFKGLKPGENVKIKFCSYETNCSNYVFPRWYVSAPGKKPLIVENTNDEEMNFVADFDTAEQWKRSIEDTSNPFTATKRFQQYQVADLGKAPMRVVPSPVLSNLVDYTQVIIDSKHWFAYSISTDFSSELCLLKNIFGIAIAEKNCPASKVIVLRKGFISGVRNCVDAYMIDIDSNSSTINITASAPSGVFYAIQTLHSLAEPSKQGTSYKLPSGLIKDAPRFDYRGLLIDVARNFIKLEDLLLIIRSMASYKLNKLVLHLADNEGWRIEIDGLPELTKIGAVRKHSEMEEDGIYPAFGSGPYDNTSGSGYYSSSDYKKILVVAAENCIELIPNIGMPGNLHAAIVAMNVRYKRLMQENKAEKAQEFLLADRNSKSNLTCLYNYKNSFANPYLDSTYNFIGQVLACLKDMHSNIQPLKVVLLGGDGISNDKVELFKDFDKGDFQQVLKTSQELFTYKVSKLCLNLGLKLGIYGNGALKKSFSEPYEKSIFNDQDVLVYAVNPRWAQPYSQIVHKFANADYKVVLGHCSTFFFDHPQEPDPTEKGLSWAARYIDDRAIFSFMPEKLSKNDNSDTYTLITTTVEKTSVVELKKPENVVGIQASLWTELLRNSEAVHHQLFPRMLAFAERAWHKAEWEESSAENWKQLRAKDWEEFANVVGYKEMPRLQNRNISYRIPPPGISISDELFQLASLYPGFSYLYRKAQTNSSSSWMECKNNDHLPDCDSSYEFKTTDGRRCSRIVKVNADELNANRFTSRMRHFDAFMSY